VSGVGGTLTVTAAASVTAVVSVASSTSGVAALQGLARRPMAFGGVNVTPLYYVGVTNTGSTQQTVNFQQLKLNVGTLPSGASVGLAHYDPSVPQNGWNQHCAFGSGQATNNGDGTATFVPGGSGANITIYPGATLYFAPYVYPTNLGVVPTPPPAATPVPPTAPTPPSSLNGTTYIGSAQQTSPSVQPAQYLQVSITQSGTSLSGTIAALPSGPNQNGFFATFTGTMGANGSFTLAATPQGSGNCPATIQGTASGNTIGGTFTSPACAGGNGQTDSGNFYATAQSSNLPALSGTYSGTINDSTNGQGTISIDLSTQPGSVFGGNVTVNWPANPQAGGTSPFAGFFVNTTTADFTVFGGSCQPSGTLTISGNTLSATYTGGGNGQNSCSGHGTFTVSH
jgi:hypothetical protein